MSLVMLVTRPFEGAGISDLIGGGRATERIQLGAHAHDVVQVMLPRPIADKCKEI